VINRIEWVREGADAGRLRLTISTSPFTSTQIIADQSLTQGILSLSNDDMGENDIENNLVEIMNFRNAKTNEVTAVDQFLLPADSYKDLNTLDWVLSIKGEEGSTDALFHDLMINSFQEKLEAPAST